jgi:hypothetical protein
MCTEDTCCIIFLIVMYVVELVVYKNDCIEHMFSNWLWRLHPKKSMSNSPIHLFFNINIETDNTNVRNNVLYMRNKWIQLKTKLGINYPSDYCFYEPESN